MSSVAEAGSRNARRVLHTVQRSDSHRLMLGGVDIAQALGRSVQKNAFEVGHKRQMQRFARSEDGVAFAEAVASLYLLGEKFEHNLDIAKMKVGFGLVRTAMEAMSGQMNGVDEALSLVTADSANRMRARCVDARCAARSAQFMVHSNGFFDVVSAPAALSAAAACAPSTKKLGIEVETARNLTVECPPEGCCFGACGPGCFTPGNVQTPECYGHDTCVNAFSHAECLFLTPTGGACARGNCYSLIQAMWSYIRAIFGGTTIEP